jgi:hypothetical protein
MCKCFAVCGDCGIEKAAATANWHHGRSSDKRDRCNPCYTVWSTAKHIRSKATALYRVMRAHANLILKAVVIRCARVE